jgi:hypothetical protein
MIKYNLKKIKDDNNLKSIIHLDRICLQPEPKTFQNIWLVKVGHLTFRVSEPLRRHRSRRLDFLCFGTFDWSSKLASWLFRPCTPLARHFSLLDAVDAPHSTLRPPSQLLSTSRRPPLPPSPRRLSLLAVGPFRRLDDPSLHSGVAGTGGRASRPPRAPPSPI